jgi:uncharacterized protein (TIGR01777 family)
VESSTGAVSGEDAQVKILVAGASGLIGQPLVRRLRADGHDVVQLVRREPRRPGEARWDPGAGTIDAAALDGVDAVVNLAGAGVGDRRWTPEYQRVIRDSRLQATRTLATAVAERRPRPRVLLNASAIGYYGDRGDEPLTEASGPGRSFLAGVVRDWEAATTPARDAGVRVTLLRTGLVMAPHGGAFGRLLPLFRLGLGGRLGNGRMWWSWITLEDQIGAIRFLLEQEVAGPVNLTGPAPARNAEVTRALAGALHRPALFAVPPVALRVGRGRLAEDLRASQRVLPERLLEAGYAFRHPDLAGACSWLAAG